jgi:hypothetical protein
MVILSENGPQFCQVMNLSFSGWGIWATVVGHSVQVNPVDVVVLHYPAPFEFEEARAACPCLLGTFPSRNRHAAMSDMSQIRFSSNLLE